MWLLVQYAVANEAFLQLNSTESGKSGFDDMAFNIIVAFGIGIHFLEVSYELYSSQNVSRKSENKYRRLSL